MRALVRQLLPHSVRSRIHRWRVRREHSCGRLYCPVCENPVLQFLPHGIPPRPDILCPICRSKACHRLAWAWFRTQSRLFQPDGCFVHIAPEPELGRRLSARCHSVRMNYISGDIRDSRNTINILDLRFADQSVDVLFACHVVNMVPDDKKAFAEVFRVLKPSGVAILPVPIHSNANKTVEAGPNGTPEERLQLFGDAMMFRKYSGEDYSNRLSDANFEARTIRPADINDFEVESWRLCDEWLQIGVRYASSKERDCDR